VTQTVQARGIGAAQSLPARDVLDRLEVSADRGLDAEEAERRLGEFGPNVVERETRDGIFRLL